jgi:hypothetical protein
VRRHATLSSIGEQHVRHATCLTGGSPQKNVPPKVSLRCRVPDGAEV